MTDGSSEGTGSEGTRPEDAVIGPDEPEQAHRVRRRRGPATRPAGPPIAGPDRADSTADPVVPVAVPAIPAPTSEQAPEQAGEILGVAGAVANPEPKGDPVARADRRREKKRRIRTERLAAEAAAASAAAAVADAVPNDGADTERSARRRRAAAERGAHALEGNRATQLPSAEAMRAREWAAPGPADLAAAEAELVIVRRHYRPPEPLPTKSRPATGQQNRTGSRPPAERRGPPD